MLPVERKHGVFICCCFTQERIVPPKIELTTLRLWAVHSKDMRILNVNFLGDFSVTENVKRTGPLKHSHNSILPSVRTGATGEIKFLALGTSGCTKHKCRLGRGKCLVSHPLKDLLTIQNAKKKRNNGGTSVTSVCVPPGAVLLFAACVPTTPTPTPYKTLIACSRPKSITPFKSATWGRPPLPSYLRYPSAERNVPQRSELTSLSL